MLNIDDLHKSFPARRHGGTDVVAVNGVSLEIEEGELFTLLGPSGCGKTTTLRSVAGFERPTSGRITVADRVLYDSQRHINLPASARGLGVVFQSYAIWPHMNVFKNVAFPLTVMPRSRRPSRKQIRERVERVLTVVHLEKLVDRPATDLSGGQQQRLALARALVMEPPLLLLDEPLSNLDAKLREQMRFELKRLQREMRITTVYVTHDQTEALSMSSRVAVMSNGMVEQVARPRDIYNKPATRFVADFIGTSNFLDGVVKSMEPGGQYQISCGPGDMVVESPLTLAPGDPVVVGIRPVHVEVVAGETEVEGPGIWRAKVLARGFLGDTVEHELAVGDVVIKMLSSPEDSVSAGESLLVRLPARWCTVIPS